MDTRSPNAAQAIAKAEYADQADPRLAKNRPKPMHLAREIMRQRLGAHRNGMNYERQTTSNQPKRTRTMDKAKRRTGRLQRRNKQNQHQPLIRTAEKAIGTSCRTSFHSACRRRLEITLDTRYANDQHARKPGGPIGAKAANTENSARNGGK